MPNTMGGGWRNPDYGFDPQGAMGGLGGLLGGMFGNSGKPYDSAMEEYERWANKAQGVQQPYLDAGKNAIGKYQGWLSGMEDPSQFINGLMQNYQQSPYTSYLQQQAHNAGINSGSASGLTGSSALGQQMQQNAANISQQGMDSWLKNVLGINSEYGQGQNNLMGYGQNSANALTNMYGNMGKSMGEAAYGRDAAGQGDFWNSIAGGIGLLGAFI
ncbi:MAG TPA: hypothetical protein ACFYDZ_00345 [Candidatus Brocadiaceae bacterium]